MLSCLLGHVTPFVHHSGWIGVLEAEVCTRSNLLTPIFYILVMTKNNITGFIFSTFNIVSLKLNTDLTYTEI